MEQRHPGRSGNFTTRTTYTLRGAGLTTDQHFHRWSTLRNSSDRCVIVPQILYFFRLVVSSSATVIRLQPGCYLPLARVIFFNPLRFLYFFPTALASIGKGISAILEAFRQLIKLEYLGRSMFSERTSAHTSLPSPFCYRFLFPFFPYLPMPVPTSLLSCLLSHS